MNKLSLSIGALALALNSYSQPFPLSKTLTVSAKEYCESVGKKLSDYELVGVHGCGKPSELYSEYDKHYVYGAEAVVGFKVEFGQAGGDSQKIACYSGTALVPKTKPLTRGPLSGTSKSP